MEVYMLVLKNDFQKSKSVLVSLVYDFLDDVATFDSGEYEVNAQVSFDVIYTVKADSASEAEDADFFTDEHTFDDDNYSSRFVNSATKVDASARDAVESICF
jgi:hypothetical protein